jgi:hypothetical protein
VVLAATTSNQVRITTFLFPCRGESIQVSCGRAYSVGLIFDRLTTVLGLCGTDLGALNRMKTLLASRSALLASF